MKLKAMSRCSWPQGLLLVALGFILSVGLLARDTAKASHRGGGGGSTITKFSQPLQILPQLTGGEHVEDGVVTPSVNPPDTVSIVASDKLIPVPGLPNSDTNPTKFWTIGGFSTPPTIRRPTGVTAKVKFIHNLTEIKGPGPQGLGEGTQTGIPGDHSQLTIHHHGAHVTPKNDGWACGFYFGGLNNARNGEITYIYANRENDEANDSGNERAVTQWYHNHRVDVTGHTVWKGLGGGHFILDSDPAEATLPLPRGQYDVPLTLRDIQFDADNQIPYTFNFDGVTGNVITANGVPWPFFNVEPRKYRFRVLNVANIRVFHLRLRREGSSTDIDMTQIASEAGLMAAPVNRRLIRIGIAERLEFVIDFAPHAGRNLILQNVQSTREGGDCVPGNCNSDTAQVMQFRVGTTVSDPSNNEVPATLRPIPTPDQMTPVAKRRSVIFTREGTHWTLRIGVEGERPGDDRIMDCARTDADPVVNTVEEWTINNPGNWTHSIHTHDVDQVCVSINGSATANGCNTFNAFKETWPFPPNTTVVFRIKPTDFTQAAFDPDSTPCNLAGAEQPPNPDNTGECADVDFADNSGDLTTPTHTPDRHGGDNVTGDQAAAEAAGGRYMMHCHVVEHEDLAMMTQWRVKSSPEDGAVREVPCDPPGSCTN